MLKKYYTFTLLDILPKTPSKTYSQHSNVLLHNKQHTPIRTIQYLHTHWTNRADRIWIHVLSTSTRGQYVLSHFQSLGLFVCGARCNRDWFSTEVWLSVMHVWDKTHRDSKGLCVLSSSFLFQSLTHLGTGQPGNLLPLGGSTGGWPSLLCTGHSTWLKRYL